MLCNLIVAVNKYTGQVMQTQFPQTVIPKHEILLKHLAFDVKSMYD